MPDRILKCNVRYYRKKRGLSQNELAVLSGTTQNTISAMENGCYNPSLLTAYSVSRALKVSIYNLWDLEYIDSSINMEIKK